MDLSLSKRQEIAKVREARRAAVHGVTKRLELVTEQWQQQQLIMLSIGNLNLKARNSFILFFAYLFFTNLFYWSIVDLRFPGGSDGKESTCQCRKPSFDPWVQKISGEVNGYPPGFLAWRFLWTEESMGSQRVGQDWAANSFNFK